MKAQARELPARLRSFWQACSNGERLLIASLAVLVSAGFCLWLIHAVDRSRLDLRTATVPALRERVRLLERQAAEYERLRAAPPATVSPTDLRLLVQTQAGAAGLSKALLSTEAADANQVKVVFGSIAFADWLTWLGNLQAQNVQVETCRIEALTTPGLVSVTATLVRPGQK